MTRHIENRHTKNEVILLEQSSLSIGSPECIITEIVGSKYLKKCIFYQVIRSQFGDENAMFIIVILTELLLRTKELICMHVY